MNGPGVTATTSGNTRPDPFAPDCHRGLSRIISSITTALRGCPMLETRPDDGGHDDEWLTSTQAAEYLKRTRHALAMWRMENVGPRYVKLGNRCLYRRSDLRAFAIEHMVGTQDQPADYVAPIYPHTDEELTAGPPRAYAWPGDDQPRRPKRAQGTATEARAG